MHTANTITAADLKAVGSEYAEDIARENSLPEEEGLPLEWWVERELDNGGLAAAMWRLDAERASVIAGRVLERLVERVLELRPTLSGDARILRVKKTASMLAVCGWNQATDARSPLGGMFESAAQHFEYACWAMHQVTVLRQEMAQKEEFAESQRLIAKQAEAEGEFITMRGYMDNVRWAENRIAVIKEAFKSLPLAAAESMGIAVRAAQRGDGLDLDEVRTLLLEGWADRQSTDQPTGGKA